MEGGRVVWGEACLEVGGRAENYSGRWFGPTRLRVALYKSRNLVSIRLLQAIGVDYAVNIYTRYRIERETNDVAESLTASLKETGRAVTLCSLTTIIGYGSLLPARNGPLSSFGKAAVRGEFACRGAAPFAMTA